jgi:DNA-binding GntR family transcriptional regulator
MGIEQAQDRTTQTYERLRELIVKGKLAPGARVIESDVAERLGVSRTPIRASLQRLEQEGFVLRGGNGQQWRPTVAPLTREDAKELFEMTGQLEGLAARYACELPEDVHADIVEKLRQRNHGLLELAQSGSPDPVRYWPLDEAFHRAYVEAAAGPRLFALNGSLRPQVERYGRVYTLMLPDKVETSYREHRVIIDRIEQRDADGAQAAVEANWRGAALRLGAVIDHIGERGSW